MKALLLLLWTASLPASVLQVVCYHRFAPDCGKDPYCVTDAELKAQLDWLKAEGWQSVGLAQVAQALDGKAELPAKAVMLSVDDGYKAGARGADAFEAAGFRGVYFVNPGSLAGPKRAAKSAFMTPEGVRDLEARGHDVGSHGMTHANLGKVPEGMDIAGYQRWLRKELAGARERLESILGRPVEDLAWPFGAYNQAVLKAAQDAGYRRCYSVTDASAQMPGADPLRLPRYLVQRPYSLASFKRHFDAADAPLALNGLRDGQIQYEAEGSKGFRFESAVRNGRPARILVQRARPAWKPYFDSLLTPPSAP